MRALVLLTFSFNLFAGVGFTDPAGTKEQYSQAEKYANRVRDQLDADLVNGSRMLSVQHIDTIIRKGVAYLKDHGHDTEADQITQEWETAEQFNLYSDIGNLKYRHIGDHAPISQWLKNTSMTFRILLGVNIWKGTHLSDLETLNSGLPVVVKPCSFPMDSVTIQRQDEYRNHFAYDDTPSGGDELYGVGAVLTYWAVETPCLMATGGLLGLFCSPVSSIAESLFGKHIGQKLSDKIFTKMCLR